MNGMDMDYIDAGDMGRAGIGFVVSGYEDKLEECDGHIGELESLLARMLAAGMEDGWERAQGFVDEAARMGVVLG